LGHRREDVDGFFKDIAFHAQLLVLTAKPGQLGCARDWSSGSILDTSGVW
jgi:hypothetical protein